ncbi:MAG: VOC family protein [Alphaproteobacteria bacterium]|nr:VOC family protein [Alphaproteobacteria bacterium]
MPVQDIIHVAIKTMDLDATNKFYTEVLGMEIGPRPPMDIPGSWLNFDGTQIHVLAGEKAFADEKDTRFGTGTVDHIAVQATSYDEMKESALRYGCDIRENDIETAGLWQLFVKDPNGVVVEMNFMKANEPNGSKGPDPANQYYFARF